jgi:hypothetical protein
VANFSTIFVSVVDTGGKFATGVATISGCRHLKVNLKAKIYIYVTGTLLPKDVQTKLLKFFCLKVFPFATSVEYLERRISPRNFEKVRNGPDGIIRGLGETGSRKKPQAKNLVTLSL